MARIKALHYGSGIGLSLFVFIHLANHFSSVLGPETHIQLMNSLRIVYRNPLVETVLMISVLIQIISGIKLAINRLQRTNLGWDKVQVISGAYLTFFLSVHCSAVWVGRLFLHLDTNIYFAMAGLNTEYYRLFFIPYYCLGVISFFSHIAAIHHCKMRGSLLGLNVDFQSIVIVIAGFIAAIVVIFGMTDGFKKASFPSSYSVLVGK